MISIGHSARLLLFFSALLICFSSCGGPSESGEIRYSRGTRTASKISYTYGEKFGRYGIADRAQAFDGATLLAEATALRIIETSSGPNQSEVEEKHYSSPGVVSYRGLLRIRFGFDGGHVDEEIPISGRPEGMFFVGWPAGN